MIKARYVLCSLALVLLLLLHCRKPYYPPAIASSGSYLVVDGIINSGNDSTIFTLSRTVSVSAKATQNPVSGAAVLIESDAGSSWPLIEGGKGRYVSGPLGLSSSPKYRVRIRTSDGLQYVSDFVPVKPTPAIDSVGYVIKNGDLQVYVNTHDPANATRYYRWDYAETWQFHTEYPSSLKADTIKHKLVYRTPDQYVFDCFGNDKSTNVLQASTTNLSSDIVYQSRLTRIALTSEKLEKKYSILVKQYALTADAYQFYTTLKKNTEQLGELFGPLPSGLTGNIHCISNPDIPVLGYITATDIQSKRIFISAADLPPAATIYPYNCELDSIASPDIFFTYPGVYVPIASGRKIYYSSRECVDCTIRGRTDTPSFWK
ncbi:MAG TPA: DUF4249 domain-containing protein [Mucilaginibacter sp.]|nr:DUF4249 domain-containing protein [Mucilaginibacter sp.]